jgi:hypothetical protein
MARAQDLPIAFSDLVAHLTRTTSLGPDAARWVVAEVLAYLDEPIEKVVRRRHRELQGEGLANADIWVRLGDELRAWRVAPPEMTERQLRRLVYG